MRLKILMVSRDGVNSLILHTNRGPRHLVSRWNEISVFEEKTLKERSENVGVRAACMGIGRLFKP